MDNSHIPYGMTYHMTRCFLSIQSSVVGDKNLEKPLPTAIPCSGTRASTMLFPMQSLAKVLSRDCVSTPPLSLVRATDLREATVTELLSS